MGFSLFCTAFIIVLFFFSFVLISGIYSQIFYNLMVILAIKTSSQNTPSLKLSIESVQCSEGNHLLSSISET